MTSTSLPYSVVDAVNHVLDQSASLERAKDRKWEIESSGYSGYIYVPPLTIKNDIPWDGQNG